MSSLTSKNIASVINGISSKGFTAKYWRDHRSKVASGSGIAKLMDKLKAYKVSPAGDLSDVAPGELEGVLATFEALYSAFGKAMTKCNKKLQAETRSFCEGYMKVIQKREKETALLIKQREQNAKNLKVARQEEQKQFDKFKDDEKKKQAIVLKEMEEVDRNALNMAKACDDMITDIKLAVVDVKKLEKALQSQIGDDGKVAAPLLSKFETGLVSIQKKHKLPIHGGNLKGALPKVLKQLTDAFPQYIKLDFAKKERIATGKSIKSAQDTLNRANGEFSIYSEAHKSMVGVMNSLKS